MARSDQARAADAAAHAAWQGRSCAQRSASTDATTRGKHARCAAAASTWGACASCCIARAYRRPRAATRRAGRKSDRTNYGSDGSFRGWPLGSSIRANSATSAPGCASYATAGSSTAPDCRRARRRCRCGRLWVRRSFPAEPSRADFTHQCSGGQETGASCRTLAPHESGCAGLCPGCRPSA